ncbi:MAG: TPM domain-containing protein [Candidatus Saccharimonadales bacterium]
MRRFAAAVFVGISLATPFSVPSLVQAAAKVPPKPTTSPIVDQAQVIDDATEQRIDTTVKAYEQKTGNQIAVLTVKSLQGEDIEGFSYRVASSWGIGDKTANNGELIVVAVSDRKVRFEVGRGLEPYLTDLQSYQIIQSYMIPQFRAGNYGAGVEQGVQKSIDVIGGERLSESSVAAPKQNWGDIAGTLVYVAIFPLMYLGSFLARSKSWWAGGLIGAVPGVLIILLAGALLAGGAALVIGLLIGLLLDYLMSKNYQERKASGDQTGWWGSGGGFFGGSSGGSSSGGWGGFGGGSFGGGGSSGSW